MNIYRKLFIGGEWRTPNSDEVCAVINPATEKVVGEIPLGNATDAEQAVIAATEAFPRWSTMAPHERAGSLRKIHSGLVERSTEVAELISAEMGMPLKLSQRIQVGLPVAVLDTYIQLIESYEFTEKIGNSVIHKEPIGVVAAITPWNFPLHQLMIKVAAALAAGCTIIVKPSELAPLNAFLLAEIIAECKLPPGVFNLVSGYGPVVGEALASHPQVDMVSFTGSTRAGTRVAQLGAESVKRVTLELGGKSAAVILDDAELAVAVKATVSNAFLNSGQTCSALTRMLVPANRYQEAASIAVEIAKGFVPNDPADLQTKIGPLVSSEQRQRVRDYIQSGIDEGAELLIGGVAAPENLPHGYYVQPTIFGKVTSQMKIAREEIFGPVLSILSYSDDNEAIQIANDSSYGLSGAVWSANPERAEKIALRMRTGQVDINGGRFNALAPFGGYRHSGNGRELGRYGLEEFLEVKSALQQNLWVENY